MNNEFKPIPPFRGWVLENFPFIEADFDAITNYQLICKVIEYLNQVIASENQQNEAIQDLYNKIEELRNYIDTVIPEDINNKLDEMAEDGTLANLLNNYASLIKVYNIHEDLINDLSLVAGQKVKTLGYYSINDGGGSEYYITDTEPSKYYETLENGKYAELIIKDKKINIMQLGLSNKEDYTIDFNNLSDIINDSNIEEINFNNEIYNVVEPIIFDLENEKIIFNFNGGTIKLNDNIKYFNSGIFTINMNKDIESKCYIINGTFDGSGVTPSFLDTDVSPNGGRGMFFINGARYIKADNLYFHDWFYSACIWSHYCSNADITNITGIRVGGRSATNDEDARGDALYFGYTGVVEDDNNDPLVDGSQNVNIRVENCNFSSYDFQENPYSSNTNIRNGCKSGRCGIVFGEFSETNAEKNLYINNCYFYNYQRVIHLEAVYKVNIYANNVKFEDYGQVLLLAVGIKVNNIKFSNCNFIKNNNVIAIYNSYKYIIAGHTDNNVKNILFDNCFIDDKYNGYVLYGKGINIMCNDSIINFTNCDLNGNVFLKLNNSTFNYNKCILYNSVLHINNCIITGGYLNDEHSMNFIKWTGQSYYDTTLNTQIKNCKCLNVGILASNKIILANNELNYDSNFINKDDVGITRNYFFSFYIHKLIKFANNIVNNTNTTIVNLVDNTVGENSNFSINDNVFNNVKLSIFNLNGYKCKIYNNKFVITDESITSGGDFYGSKAVIHDNLYLGCNAPSNLGNALKYQNYVSTDGTLPTLIS